MPRDRDMVLVSIKTVIRVADIQFAKPVKKLSQCQFYAESQSEDFDFCCWYYLTTQLVT